jgi:actin-related protein
MKALVTWIFLMMAGTAAAHNSCNLELDAGVLITADSIEFYDAAQPTYKIVGDKYVVVNGQALKLNDLQQQLVENYAAGIRAAVPEVREMVLEGIDLAITGITFTFDNLLGEKNQISTQLTTELNNVKSDVKRYFSAGNPINFNVDSEGIPDFLGKQFETRIERIVETSVQNSIGSLMIAMGKEIMMSGGNMEAFEQRMNQFGEQMEQQMNARAAGMEARGEKLCDAMLDINAIEEQLKHSIPAVESFNFIRIDAAEAEVARHSI